MMFHKSGYKYSLFFPNLCDETTKSWKKSHKSALRNPFLIQKTTGCPIDVFFFLWKRRWRSLKKQRRCFELPTPMFCPNNAVVFYPACRYSRLKKGEICGDECKKSPTSHILRHYATIKGQLCSTPRGCSLFLHHLEWWGLKWGLCEVFVRCSGNTSHGQRPEGQILATKMWGVDHFFNITM